MSDVAKPIIRCDCQASSATVCYMVRYGEGRTHNFRCSCPCHLDEAAKVKAAK